MKRLFLLIFISSQYIIAQSVIPPLSGANSGNWNLVFSDDFVTPTPLNTAKWVTQDGEIRWQQEQVYKPNQVIVNNGSLFLNLQHIPGGFTNPDYSFAPYKNGNGIEAKYQAGEIYTKPKFLYGYMEAKMKLPSGKGAFPALWLFPIYRERETPTKEENDDELIMYRDINTLPKLPQDDFLTGYPEEIDIIEQRSILKNDCMGSYATHIYDFCSFWNNGDASGNNQTSDSSVFFDTIKCDRRLERGEWHTFGLKWDLFGQYYYIDNNLIYTNNLWSRKTNTEPMNLIISNQILTNNPNNALIEGNTVTFPGNDISEQSVMVDFVNIWQEKKFSNPVVWDSGKSDRLGKFMLEVNSSPDTFIVGNFIASDTNSEILSFSSNGLRSSLQMLNNKRPIFKHNMNTHKTYASQTEDDTWIVNTILSEERTTIAGQYTLNNWFNPTTSSSTKYAVGNFDGTGDELFLSNSATKWSVVLKFRDSQLQAFYDYELKYSNGGTNNTISYCNGNIPSTYITTPNDTFLAGDIDGDGKDELFIFNNTNYRVLQKKDVTCNNQTYNWSSLINTGNVINAFLPIQNGISTAVNWSINTSNDAYILDNFYISEANDITDELLCINKSTGIARLYSYRIESGSANRKWIEIWRNSNPYTINIWNMASTDSYLSGSFTNSGTGKAQLLCISNNQTYTHIYEFNGTSWIVKQDNTHPLETDPAKPTPISKRYFPYIYDDSKTTLLAIEKYKNPYNSTCTGDATFSNPADKKKSNCVKYSSKLIDFSSASNSPRNQNIESEINQTNVGSDNTKDDFLSITPNPTKGSFEIIFKEKVSGLITITNESSKEILNKRIENSEKLNIDLEGKAKGVYFINMTVNDKVFLKKMILE